MLFAGGAIALLIFLYSAPEETTSRMPRDENHRKFYEIKSKKEAEKLCVGCHSKGGEYPLTDTHPDPYRCLFCHKRD
ncbi:MAG: hypothetical protein D6B25_19275 [Desulfobulbaceae bacterium]|nr:MAG: hypothetical protein D6B25_19275 [Desulfobulbaceae bacterium]